MYAILLVWHLMLSAKSRFWKFGFSSCNSLKTDFPLTYLTDGGVMAKIYSPAGLSFLSPVKIGPAKRKSVLESPVIQKFICACSAIQRGYGSWFWLKMHFGLMLMFTKVTGHFVPKSFRTQVIKYLFGHFVPTNYPFRTHVISLPLWSVNSNNS